MPFSMVSRVMTHLRTSVRRRQVEHDAEQRLLDDGAQAAGAGAALQRLDGDGVERLVGEHQLDAVQLEELLVLARERVLGLGQDAHEVVLVQVVDRADDRQAADELGDQAEVEQVLGQRRA